MGLIVIFILIYLGGPIGLGLVIIGCLGLWRGATDSSGKRARLFWALGVLLVVAAGLSLWTIAGVNFGL